MKNVSETFCTVWDYILTRLQINLLHCSTCSKFRLELLISFSEELTNMRIVSLSSKNRIYFILANITYFYCKFITPRHGYTYHVENIKHILLLRVASTHKINDRNSHLFVRANETNDWQLHENRQI